MTLVHRVSHLTGELSRVEKGFNTDLCCMTKCSFWQQAYLRRLLRCNECGWLPRYAWAYPVSPGKWTSEAASFLALRNCCVLPWFLWSGVGCESQALGYFSTSTPSAAFFIYGGYIYFDKMGRVAAVLLSCGRIIELDGLGSHFYQQGVDFYQQLLWCQIIAD